MDIEVTRMSTDTVELLDQLNAVCKRFHVNDPRASEKDRFFAEAVALHEYQLKKAHEQAGHSAFPASRQTNQSGGLTPGDLQGQIPEGGGPAGIGKGDPLHAQAREGLVLRGEVGIVGAGGVHLQQAGDLVRRSYAEQGGVRDGHQLPHRGEKTKGQQQHCEGRGERDAPLRQLVPRQGHGHCHRPENETVGEEKGAEIDLHYVHDLPVESVGFVPQTIGAALVLVV